MRKLVEQLVGADVAYYKHDSPIMTDREYDTMYDKLLRLEKSTGIVLSGSPTQKVSGEVLTGLMQVRHTKPMLSVQKTKSVDEIVKFIGDKRSVVSWKLDGLTLVLRYDKGKLKQALTRGGDGGMAGEDVTHTVRAMVNVPLVIPYTKPLEVRGEGVVSWGNFEKLNGYSNSSNSPDETYAHPRSVAAGGIRRLDSNKTKAQFLEFFAFEVVNGVTSNAHGAGAGNYTTKTEQLAMLIENGFSVVPFYVLGEGSTGKVRIAEIIDTFNPKEFEYPVDGLIIEYDDLVYGQSLGATGHHENRMIAFKWEDELYETTFLGLELATTRTGMVSLTGIFKDVVIDGTTVNRAYLHNLDIFDRYKLGVGDRVKLYKANQIIPQLAKNITRSGTLEYPSKCPCCGTVLVVRRLSNGNSNNDKPANSNHVHGNSVNRKPVGRNHVIRNVSNHKSVSGTRFLFCNNPSCPAKLVRKFVHFCHKTRMDIPDLSEKRLELFISKGWIKNFGDLYELERYRKEFIETPGLGEKLFERLIGTINRRRSCTLNQFIAALGIHTVGRSAGRILNSYFNGDWYAFEQAIMDGFDFTQLQDFGQTMHDNIYAWYSDKEAEKLWRPLLRHVTFLKHTSSQNIEKELDFMNTNNPFNGKTVVATGKLENYTRDGIQMKLLSLGAKPSGAVSKSTDYLIVGEKAGSKLDKAKSLGITILSEQEFISMAEGA